MPHTDLIATYPSWLQLQLFYHLQKTPQTHLHVSYQQDTACGCGNVFHVQLSKCSLMDSNYELTNNRVSETHHLCLCIKRDVN